VPLLKAAAAAALIIDGRGLRSERSRALGAEYVFRTDAAMASGVSGRVRQREAQALKSELLREVATIADEAPGNTPSEAKASAPSISRSAGLRRRQAEIAMQHQTANAVWGARDVAIRTHLGRALALAELIDLACVGFVRRRSVVLTALFVWLV
jgi:hypothetical protein